MPNEELIQRKYLLNGSLKGTKYGNFELLELGNTSALELSRAGLIQTIPDNVDYTFTKYKPPKKPSSTKPDSVFLNRIKNVIEPVAVREMKKPTEFNTEAKRISAIEQAIHSAIALGVDVAIASDGTEYIYIDVKSSVQEDRIVTFPETRTLNPGVLEDLLQFGTNEIKDLAPLSEKVWQAIWHATKEEPKQCLLTFVEIFVLKFLSDNLSSRVLPQRFSFYELTDNDVDSFMEKYGKTQIEYYVQDIRPMIKSIFPDNTVVKSQEVLGLFGLGTIVSTTSVINGFAFLKSSSTSLSTFNRTFMEILQYFEEYGVLTSINPEFKLRLYETFLKKSAGKQKLGQFFTPRNIVKAIVKMAQLSNLPDGAIVFDPAAGVGGFVLEPLIDETALLNNVSFQNGKPKQRIRLIGADVDTTTHILAKANTLLHLAEFLHDPTTTVSLLNDLMAEMFVLCNTNEHLGTLEHPVQNSVDVILTNPPYVTQGSKIYKDEIAEVKGQRNGVDLREYYDRTGLGLESLFLRYISGALKPGGRAFVIVPQGMLTRSETSLKDRILSECNLIASIALPRNAFFSTAQKTYILCLEKRYTKFDDRPDVFCAISSSIGESLDARRIAIEDNDLNQIADAFIAFQAGESTLVSSATDSRVRIAPAAEFSSSDRWDIQRFWTDDELVRLGAREPAIERSVFIEDVEAQLIVLSDELKLVREEINNLISGSMITVSLADERYFTIRRGKRVTRSNADANPGDIPVYSGSKDKNKPLGKVSEEWAISMGIPIETNPIVTVNANGYVGATFVRREKCIIHDDVMIIDILNDQIDLDYLEVALRSAIAEGNFEYEAKLYSRVKALTVDIPGEDQFDITTQRKIATAIRKFDALRQSIVELGKWSGEARFK